MDDHMNMDDDDSDDIIAESEIEAAEYLMNDIMTSSEDDEDDDEEDDDEHPNAPHAQHSSLNASSSSAALPTVTLSEHDTELLKQFSLEKHLQELTAVPDSNASNTTHLLSYFQLQAHWQTFVPICFNVTEDPNRHLIETEADRILIKPLEAYLCNDVESGKVFKKLEELNDPPHLCGKVFKLGEPSYFCRECGSDPTCVLCSRCFLKSKHRYHKYKMMTSGGGGYCDCGDPEAWKSHPSCELHSAASPEASSMEYYTEKLPVDMRERAKQIFTFLIEYIFDMLSCDEKRELPATLKPKTDTDDYVTLLYNDETHSYEQVVSTLKKVLGIDDQRAFEYATVVDREGRSAIKRGKMAECSQIKHKIETQTGSGAARNPLQTKVFHSSLVAHQYFAEKLISWLHKICDYHKGLKHILCQIGAHVVNDTSILEKFLLADNTFWKSTRRYLHQFYISTFFMDAYWKKEFAVVYTKNYRTIWKNYVKNPDDTETLTDLSVQIFTVISLGKHLIAHHNLFEKIMKTLIEHSKTNKGKLSFPRSIRLQENSDFRKAQFILIDLKYCLASLPDEWNDELCSSFIRGFKAFVDFLKLMHGMDSVKRVTAQHIEFEPEWETGFNLLIKLQKIIGGVVEWCASNNNVYIECYKYLLNVIREVESEPLYEYTYAKKKFKDHLYETISYDILTNEMGKFGLNYATIQATANAPKHKIINLLEPSIRALTLVSQSNAGLWKRNGYSLLSQVYFYSNIKCRSEMLDRDILCLQTGASIMNPNEFLINFLSHFNLYDFFTDFNYKPSETTSSDDAKMEYALPLSEDILELFIYIISERFDPNLSNIDHRKKLEREIMHQLCIGPMAHSDLVKNTFADNEKETGEFESILKEIAVFKNPVSGSSTKGTYELKEQHLSEYSPYYYHYAKTEKTKSEEYQLSLRKNEMDKFFKPSKLPAFNQLYANLTHLLDSDVFVQLVMCVLTRLNAKSPLATDGHFAKVMHLIGLALYEEQSDIERNHGAEKLNYKFMFLEKTCHHVSCSTTSPRKASLLSKLSPGKEEHAGHTHTPPKTLIQQLQEMIPSLTTPSFKLLAVWVLDYALKLYKSKFPEQKAASASSAQTEQHDLEASSSSPADESNSPNLEKQKNLRAEKRRNKILNQLNQMQKSFILNNKDFFETTSKDLDSQSSTATSSASLSRQHTISVSSDTMDYAPSDYEAESNVTVCLGPGRTDVTSQNIDECWNKPKHCILCQEEQLISIQMPPMVLCCHVQSSKVLSKDRATSIDCNDSFDPLFMPANLYWGVHTTSCGHIMHATCWKKYIETLSQADNRRHIRLLSYSPKRKEYLCPLCETVGNAVLPLFPHSRDIAMVASPVSDESLNAASLSQRFKQNALTYDEWIDGLKKTLENSIKKEEDKDVFIFNPCPLSTITRLMADAVALNFSSLFEFDPSSVLANFSSSPSSAVAAASVAKKYTENRLNDATIAIMDNFSNTSFTFGFTTYPNDADVRMTMSVWHNCAYTVQCMEQLLRAENKPLFGRFAQRQFDLLSNLVKQAALCGMVRGASAVRENCLRLLAALLPYNALMMEPSVVDAMDYDMFHSLVVLCLAMPCLYDDAPKISAIPCGGLNEANVFRLILQAHCVQILLAKCRLNTWVETVAGEPMESEDEAPSPIPPPKSKAAEMRCVYDLYKYLAAETTCKGGDEAVQPKLHVTIETVYETLADALLPFLRCAAIFFSFLTDIVSQSDLSAGDKEEQVTSLLQFLGIKNGSFCNVLNLKSSFFKKLVDSWLLKVSSSSNKDAMALTTSTTIDYPLKPNKLIDLPYDFIDLMSSLVNTSDWNSSNAAASTSSSISATTICLVCGERLLGPQISGTELPQQKIGKTKVGMCTYHTYKCGRSFGMFLRVAECQIVLLDLNLMHSEDDLLVRGCYIAAPYLDDYGETDQSLRRGNPLHLCQARYDKLYQQWLAHAVTNEISRSQQNNHMAILGTDWALI